MIYVNSASLTESSFVCVLTRWNRC